MSCACEMLAAKACRELRACSSPSDYLHTPMLPFTRDSAASCKHAIGQPVTAACCTVCVEMSPSSSHTTAHEQCSTAETVGTAVSGLQQQLRRPQTCVYWNRCSGRQGGGKQGRYANLPA